MAITIFKVKCWKCGRPGKSKYPDGFYTCGVCYYAGFALGSRAKAEQLRKRATKLEEKAKRFEEKSEGYLKKWGPPPEQGGKS